MTLCEISLNDTVEVPDPLLDNYTFVCKNNAANSWHGGVGLLYKNYLPLLVRDDLGFDGTLVVELKFGRKKIFLQYYIAAPPKLMVHLNLKIFSKILSVYMKK